MWLQRYELKPRVREESNHYSKWILCCLREQFVSFPKVGNRLTEEENQVIVTDHCIIHAHAKASSSVRMVS